MLPLQSKSPTIRLRDRIVFLNQHPTRQTFREFKRTAANKWNHILLLMKIAK